MSKGFFPLLRLVKIETGGGGRRMGGGDELSRTNLSTMGEETETANRLPTLSSNNSQARRSRAAMMQVSAASRGF